MQHQPAFCTKYPLGEFLARVALLTIPRGKSAAVGDTPNLFRGQLGRALSFFL